MVELKQFSCKDVECKEQETVYDGFFKVTKTRLRHRLFGGGFSKVIQRELFVRGHAAGVLLYDPVNQLIGLVEQFRIGAMDEPEGPWSLEVIAGMIEPGDSPEQTAKKELLEEAGISNVSLKPICDYLSSPGGTDEKVFLFCGLTSLKGKEGVFGLAHEHEDIRFHVLPEKQVFNALNEGSINNAATTIALLWLSLHKTELSSAKTNHQLVDL